MPPRLHASHRALATQAARPTEVQEVRDAAVHAAVAAALGGASRELAAQLCKRSNLPGPRPNHALAAAVGLEVAAAARKGDGLVRELLGWDPERAPAGTVQEFLPIVGAACLAARWRAGIDRRGAMADLQSLAGDPRHLVRAAVVVALRAIAHDDVQALLRELAAWTDGYLQAAVAIETLGDRELLAALRAPEEALARVDEAFATVEGAPRSHERTQGWRAVVAILGEVPALLLARFPDATAELLERRAATRVPELRDAIARVIERAREAGHAPALVQRLRDALAASEPPIRDVGRHVEHTRGRGRKAGRTGAKR